MTQKQRPILHFLATIGGSQYVFGTLRFNARDFSYFFTYPKDSPEIHLNCDTGEPTSRFDHISWHDGLIHIKRCDNIAIERMRYPGSLLITPPILTPLYVESFYFNEIPCLIQAKDFNPWNGCVSQEILSLDSSTGFSLVFLLVPSRDSTFQILMGLQFAYNHDGLSYPLVDLCDLKHRPTRMKVWENWDIVIVPTRFVQRTLSSIPPAIGSCRLPNYRNVPAALTDLIQQANNLTKPIHKFDQN